MVNAVELQSMVGGALQEKFQKAFERVIDNLQDVNTPYKNKREINIKMKFSQDEDREDVSVEINVSEKLAPQSGIKTTFAIGRDLRTGEVYAEEYGRHMNGQMTFDDYDKLAPVEKVIDTETGEIRDTVVDFRKAAK